MNNIICKANQTKDSCSLSGSFERVPVCVGPRSLGSMSEVKCGSFLWASVTDLSVGTESFLGGVVLCPLPPDKLSTLQSNQSSIHSIIKLTMHLSNQLRVCVCLKLVGLFVHYQILLEICTLPIEL